MKKIKIMLIVSAVIGVFGFLTPALLSSCNTALIFLGIVLSVIMCMAVIYGCICGITWLNKKHKLFE